MRIILPNTSVGHKNMKSPAGVPKEVQDMLDAEDSDMIIAVDNRGFMYGITVRTLYPSGVYDRRG